MSWIAAPSGLYACFKHQVIDTGPVEFSYRRVYAFDEQGNALIIDQNGDGLAPAKNLRNFHGLSDHGGEGHAIRQIIAAPPGLRWTDGNGHFAPIIAYALTENGQVVAMLPQMTAHPLDVSNRPGVDTWLTPTVKSGATGRRHQRAHRARGKAAP